MKLSDLKANPKNPRKISDKKLAALKKSVEKFGDLSGFVYNRRTKTLVSGHQRQKALQNGTVKIEVSHETPTAAFTVAEGYVLINGERFKYREVDADPAWEVEALLAANKHGGEWDRDLLRLNLAEFPALDLEASGFELAELSAMNIEMPRLQPMVQPDSTDHWEHDETDDNPADHYEHDHAEESDEEYVANNPGPESEVRQEQIDTINRAGAFEAVEENTQPAGRRIIIIIDCPTDEVKAELKEKLRPIVEPTGAKYF